MQERMDADTVINLIRPMPVHQRISALRRLYRMSQSVLAERIKVDRSSVSSWEADPSQERAHAPNEEMRDRLAYLFGIPAYVLTPDFGMHNYKQLGLVPSIGQVTPEMQTLHQKAPRADYRTVIERARVEENPHPGFHRVHGTKEEDFGEPMTPEQVEHQATEEVKQEEAPPVVMPPPPGVTRL